MRSTSRSGALLPRLRTTTALFVAIALAGVVLRIITLLGGELDYDEGVYWESLRSMSNGHALFTSTYSSQPPAFLTIMQVPYALLGHSILGARIGVLALTALGSVALVRLVYTHAGARAAVIAALLVAVDPLAIRESVTLQADSPSVWMGVLAVVLVAEVTSRSDARAHAVRFLAGGLLAAAVLTKLFAVGFLAPVAAIVGVSALPSEAGGRVALRRGLVETAAIGIGGVVVAGLFLAPYISSWNLVWTQAVSGHIAARGLREGGLSGEMRGVLLREAPLAAAAIAGVVVAARRTPRLAVVMVAWLVPTTLLLIFQHPVWPHHVLLVVPGFIACAAAPLATLTTADSTRVRQVTVIGLALAGIFFIANTRMVLTQYYPTDTAEALTDAAPTTTLIVTDEQYTAALAGFNTPPELVDTSLVRLNSTELNAAAIEAIINREHVGIISLATGRLGYLPGFRQWVEQEFPHQHDGGGGAVIYTR